LVLRPAIGYARTSPALEKDLAMSEHVYKIVELVGSSPTGIEDAIQNAIARASSTIDNIRWFEVTDTRGHVENGKIAHFQVTIKVGFTVKD
jgi:flavin-binding protein dodecin